MTDSQRICSGTLKCCTALFLILLLLACSPSKAKGAAESGVPKFHAQLDAAQYHDIYSQASEEFRKADTEARMTDFFAAVHRKLGPVQSSSEQTYFVNFTTSGTMVTLTYSTQFANGNGAERFVWRVVGDQPVLVGYRIDSRALITN